MAALTKRRCKWYARVRIWDNDIRKEKEIQIPLQTKSRVTALERLYEVRKVESDIKNGISFTFPWESDDTQIKVSRLPISKAIVEWMDRREKMGRRPKTLKINQNGLMHLVNSLGKSYPLQSVDMSSIDTFTDYMIDKGLSTTTVNMHLRTVKSMLRYYWKRGRLDRVPIIEQQSIEERDPIYITDNEFQSIMELDWLNRFYKRVFYFYRETGCRLREPFFSTLDGDWLDIPNSSKGKKPRGIELSKSLIQIYMELMEWYKTCGLVEESKGRHISKMFKKALRTIDADKKKRFHSLRHTFAVRRIVENVPIFKIQKMMGHSSVATTEVYLKLELKRLKQDFPTIDSENHKPINSVIRDTDFRDTNGINYSFVDSEIIN